MGTWEGMDRKLSYVSPMDNLLNGSMNPALNYYSPDSSVLRNRAMDFSVDKIIKQYKEILGDNTLTKK
jgi:hypothetical protein